MKNKNLILIVIILLLASCTPKPQQLLILCTNDSHSQIEAKNGSGGFAARADLVDSLRQIYPLNLLLDAGDMVQGTPYFNVYHGRIEMAGYNRLGYDAVTLGNHEFDFGLDTLAMFLNLAAFPIVSCNYDVKGTPLENIVKPYAVFERGGMKIAVIGFGVSPKSLILPTNFEPIQYLDPIERGNFYADSLRKSGCDFVIALSHLGYYSDSIPVGDSILAVQSKNIDLILGGHTHDVRKDTTIMNVENRPVHYLTTKKAGLEMDKVIVNF
ncbi:MAG: metallophosphatase [Prevotellaceae bacterium]|jgi:5'-nucleotidase|nr:metallophosphatase [Prevotellaceae bacterium]